MAAPSEESVRGQLKRVIKFGGQQDEDFKGWQRAVTSYLEEWCVDYHLRDELAAVTEGPARVIVLSEAVKDNPKKAWDALAVEYDRRADMEVEIALGDWYRMVKKASESGSQFLTRLDSIADCLAKKGRTQDDKAKLAKARECLLTDKRYRHVIEGSLLNDGLTYASLKRTIVELDVLHNAKPTKNSEEDPRKRPDGSIIRDGNCSHCGKRGHFAFECRNKEKPQTEDGKRVEEELKKRGGRGRRCQEANTDEEPVVARRAQTNKHQLQDYDLVVDSAAFPSFFPNASNED
jgi:hypothetical protein